MDAGKNVSNLRFPYLFIHVKASKAAGKGILDNTRNWSHHQNLGIKISRVQGFKNVWSIPGILTADDHISLDTTSIHVFSVEITCDFSSTIFTCLFQFGFSLRREEPSAEDSVDVEILESHIPRKKGKKFRSGWTQGNRGGSCKPFKTAEISQQNQHPKRKRGNYCQYSGEDRFKIGKCASEGTVIRAL